MRLDLAAAFLALAATYPTAIIGAPVMDQSTGNNPDLGGGAAVIASPNTPYQTFTAGISGRLTRVDVGLSYYSAAGVQLPLSGSAEILSRGEIIGSGSFTSAGLNNYYGGSPTFKTINLSGINVVAGNEYSLRLSANSLNYPDGFFSWEQSLTNIYNGGRSAPSFVDGDFSFRSFVDAFGPINPRTDSTLKSWASDAQQLFQRTADMLTMAGDVAAWIDGKAVQEIALKRIFNYSAERLVKMSTGIVEDDLIFEFYKQATQLNKLTTYTISPHSATVAGAKFLNKAFIFGLDEIIEDPPRFDYDEVQGLRPAFDRQAWGDLFSDPFVPEAHLDMISCMADMTDANYAMLLAAERAWGAALDGASDALTSQNSAYNQAAAKTNAALGRCRHAAQTLAPYLPDPQALEELGQMGWHLVGDDDIELLRQFFRASGMFDDAQIDFALNDAYRENALEFDPSVFNEFRLMADGLASLGPAPAALLNGSVPEPTTPALVVLGLGVIAILKRGAIKRPGFAGRQDV